MLPLSSSTYMPPPAAPPPRRRRLSAPSSTTCHHSSSAIVDVLVLVLVFFSCAFLVASFSSYVLQCLVYLLPPLFLHYLLSHLHYAAAALVLLPASAALVFEISSGRSLRPWSRRCRNPRCKGMRKAMEFDVRLQTEDAAKCLVGEAAEAWREIDQLPWKGDNPDYDCLRKELRRLAPPNGRAVLLFRARCGCPLAKLEAWGPRLDKQPRRRA